MIYINYQPFALESKIYIKDNSFQVLSNAYSIAQMLVDVASSYNIWEAKINSSEDFADELKTIVRNKSGNEIKIEVI